MSFFANNIKLLRQRKHLSQDAVAKKLNLTRSSLSGYENSTAQAPYEVLIKLSDFYSLSIDVILKKDISKIPEKNLSNMEQSGNYDIYGTQLRTIVVSHADDDTSNCELVPMHAINVYNTSYNDPEFIKELPLMKLPLLADSKKYRAFPVLDDSMIPIIKGSYIIGEYLTDWSNVKNGEYYIIISESKGVLFKQVFTNNLSENNFQLCANDPTLKPFDINISDINEIWKFAYFISNSLQYNNNPSDNLYSTVKELQRRINSIEKYLKI